MFNLEISYTDLVKNVLLLDAIDKNYFKEIIYIHILFFI